MHSFKKIGINTGAQLLVKLLSSITTLVASFFISRYLGFSIFGSFTKITTFVALFYLVSDFGLNTVFLQKYHADPDTQFGNFVWLRLLFSSALTVFALLITLALPYSARTGTGYSLFEKWGIGVYAFTIITYAMSLSLTVFLQKKLSYERSILPSISSMVIFFAVLFIGMVQKNLYIILLSFVLQGIALCFHLFFVVKRKLILTYSPNSFSEFSKHLFVLSFPLAFMLFLNLIYAKADTLLLSFMKPSYDVGVYGFSYRIFEFLLAVPLFFSNSVYPLLLATQDNTVLFVQRMKQYMRILFISSVCLTVAGFFLSPLLGVFFPQFAPAVSPLQILLLSLPFFFLTSLLQWFFIIRKQLLFLILVYGGTMMLNIVLNLVFIPHFSYHASAFITFLTEGIVFLGMISYLIIREPNFLRKK